MGWATPAAIGAKIGQPDRQVVCILGDGDFLMTSQEIGVAAQHEIPVVFVVQNNAGFMSIRGGQRKLMDRFILSEFTRKGQPYAVDMTAIGKAFGIDSVRIEDSDSMESTFARALASEGPTLIEVPTSRDAAGPWVPGWWDFPVPDYHQGEEQEEYKEKMAAEQHQ
jgi:acetolactate synthase-1/2/3 large subunit